MAFEESEQNLPPDEIWWERELLRNQKLMDKYMEVLEHDPDWEKWKTPEDLYNKVHYGIEPPAWNEGEEEEPDLDPIIDTEEACDDSFVQLGTEQDHYEASVMAALELGREGEETYFGSFGLEEFERAAGSDPDQDEGYLEIAWQAREFAVHAFQLKVVPDDADVFTLSAGKIGANLAGGHGLGYDDASLCGNIVKCRWALADSEFCRQILEPLAERNGRTEYAVLLAENRKLSAMIRDRIERLRARVWWQRC